MSPEQMLARQVELLVQQNSLLWWYVLATFVIAVATVTQEWLRGLLARVKLVVQTDEVVSTPMGEPAFALAHYVRLRLLNRSFWKTARNVEVVVEKVSKKGQASGVYVSGGNLFGISLERSHFPGTGTMPQLAAGTSRTVDLGHVMRPAERATFTAGDDPWIENKPGADPARTVFKLGTVISPLHRNYLLEPGEWEIELRVSGENVRSRRITVSVNLVGSWSDDPALFAQDCFTYKVR